MEKDKYKCSVCKGNGEGDIGWYCPIIVKCENCNGTGYCDWIRNIRPIYYNESKGKWE